LSRLLKLQAVGCAVTAGCGGQTIESFITSSTDSVTQQPKFWKLPQTFDFKKNRDYMLLCQTDCIQLQMTQTLVDIIHIEN